MTKIVRDAALVVTYPLRPSHLFTMAAIAIPLLTMACSSNDPGSAIDSSDAMLRRHRRHGFDAGGPTTPAVDAGSSADSGAQTVNPSDAGTEPTTASGGTSPVPVTGACPQEHFTAPTLVNPQDPRDHGAKCDGVTDDTAAFQAAMNAGDVKVSGGTCVINQTVEIKVGNKHLECTPGTVLKRSIRADANMFRYSGTLSDDSIVNCDFEGANTPVPEVDWNAVGHWDIPIETLDNVSNFLLAGNTFSQFYGQSMFQTYSEGNAGSGDEIVFNTFKSCAYYGPVFVGHTNGHVAYNQVIDCTAGVENDNGQEDTGGNIFECNKVTANLTSGVITGGVYGVNTDYSTNVVRNNLVTGNNTFILEAHRENGQAAQYVNNTCSSGCQIDP